MANHKKLFLTFSTMLSTTIGMASVAFACGSGTPDSNKSDGFYHWFVGHVWTGLGQLDAASANIYHGSDNTFRADDGYKVGSVWTMASNNGSNTFEQVGIMASTHTVDNGVTGTGYPAYFFEYKDKNGGRIYLSSVRPAVASTHNYKVDWSYNSPISGTDLLSGYVDNSPIFTAYSYSWPIPDGVSTEMEVSDSDYSEFAVGFGSNSNPERINSIYYYSNGVRFGMTTTPIQSDQSANECFGFNYAGDFQVYDSRNN